MIVCAILAPESLEIETICSVRPTLRKQSHSDERRYFDWAHQFSRDSEVDDLGISAQLALMTPKCTDDSAIAAAMLETAAARGPAASFCPSEIARQLAGPAPEQWSRLMQPVRRVAVELASSGRLVILRKGKPVDPHDFKGVYRLAQPRFD